MTTLEPGLVEAALETVEDALKWYDNGQDKAVATAALKQLEAVAPLLKRKWLIWSNEHLNWWKPNSNGYCARREDAGLFCFEEALAIVCNANSTLVGTRQPDETMVMATEEECAAVTKKKRSGP